MPSDYLVGRIAAARAAAGRARELGAGAAAAELESVATALECARREGRRRVIRGATDAADL